MYISLANVTLKAKTMNISFQVGTTELSFVNFKQIVHKILIEKQLRQGQVDVNNRNNYICIGSLYTGFAT